MDSLQFSLFYEVFSSAELCKVLCLTTKMSHYSVIIALFYLFLFFVVAIRSIAYLWAFIAVERPFPSEILCFLLHNISLGKAKHSADFTLNY